MTFPQYDDQSQNRFHKVTEFSNDVYVHGKLYADLVGGLSGDGGALSVDDLIAAIITPDKDIIPNAENLEPAYIVFENYEKI